MKVIESGLGGVLLFEPAVHGDARGFFYESYREDEFRQAAGTDRAFVQDNHSRSARHVLRGLHYQVRQPQPKTLPKCPPQGQSKTGASKILYFSYDPLDDGV